MKIYDPNEETDFVKGQDHCGHTVELDHAMPKAHVLWLYLELARYSKYEEEDIDWGKVDILEEFLLNMGGAETTVTQSFAYICTFCNQTKTDMMPFVTDEIDIKANTECFEYWGELVKKEIPRILNTEDLSVRTTFHRKCGFKWSTTSAKCLFTWIYQWLVTLRINEKPDSVAIKVKELENLNSKTPHHSVIKGLENSFYNILAGFSKEKFDTEWEKSVKKHLSVELPNHYVTMSHNLYMNMNSDEEFNIGDFVIHTYLWNDVNHIQWPAVIRDVEMQGKSAIYTILYIGGNDVTRVDAPGGTKRKRDSEEYPQDLVEYRYMIEENIETIQFNGYHTNLIPLEPKDGYSIVPSFELEKLTADRFTQWKRAGEWESLKHTKNEVGRDLYSEDQIKRATHNATEIIKEKLDAMDTSFGRSIPRKTRATKITSNKKMVRNKVTDMSKTCKRKPVTGKRITPRRSNFGVKKLVPGYNKVKQANIARITAQNAHSVSCFSNIKPESKSTRERREITSRAVTVPGSRTTEIHQCYQIGKDKKVFVFDPSDKKSVYDLAKKSEVEPFCKGVKFNTDWKTSHKEYMDNDGNCALWVAVAAVLDKQNKIDDLIKLGNMGTIKVNFAAQLLNNNSQSNDQFKKALGSILDNIGDMSKWLNPPKLQMDELIKIDPKFKVLEDSQVSKSKGLDKLMSKLAVSK